MLTQEIITRATDLHVYPGKDLGIGQRALDLGFKALGLDCGFATISRIMANSCHTEGKVSHPKTAVVI